MLYRHLADGVLLLHLGVVLFVIAGLALIWAGNLTGWRWVNGPWFRLAHAATIAVVAAQSWLGKFCPLTDLESWLRVQAGSSGYREGFIEHWVQRMLYYEAPFWVFTLAYTAFGLLVLATWWAFPPRRRRREDMPSSPGSSSPPMSGEGGLFHRRQ